VRDRCLDSGAERNLAAGRQADEIQRHRLFEAITLPRFDRSQSSMSCRASSPTWSRPRRASVQEYIAGLGERGEGMGRKRHDAPREDVTRLNETLAATNREINLVKERAAAANVQPWTAI